MPKLDVVMDAIGGASFRRSYKLLRAGGRLICFGAASLVEGERRNVVARGAHRLNDASIQRDQADVGVQVA